VVNLAAKLDEDGRLITPVRSIGYDTLVIAIGSVSNDFGTPGVKEHAICLDTPEEAARFNRRLVNACLRATPRPKPVRRASFTSRSSAPERPAPSCRRSCTAPCAGSSRSGSTRSIPTRTSRSP